MGNWTPVASAAFAYAYGGLYVNACILRNPFNYDGTSTGVPINAFIQRLEVVSEALLLQGGYMDHARKHVRAGPQRSASFDQHSGVQNSLLGTWIGSSGGGHETPKRPPISGIFPNMSVAAPGTTTTPPLAPPTPTATTMQGVLDDDGEDDDDESSGNGTFLEVPAERAASGAHTE